MSDALSPREPMRANPVWIAVPLVIFALVALTVGLVARQTVREPYATSSFHPFFADTLHMKAWLVRPAGDHLGRMTNAHSHLTFIVPQSSRQCGLMHGLQVGDGPVQWRSDAGRLIWSNHRLRTSTPHFLRYASVFLSQSSRGG